MKVGDTRGESQRHHEVKVGDTLSRKLSRKTFKKTYQERPSGAERRRPPQIDPVFMRAIDSRQESAAASNLASPQLLDIWKQPSSPSERTMPTAAPPPHVETPEECSARQKVESAAEAEAAGRNGQLVDSLCDVGDSKLDRALASLGRGRQEKKISQ